MTFTPGAPQPIHITPAGDRAVTVCIGENIDAETNRRVYSIIKHMDNMSVPGILDLVPAYTSILILYDPMQISITDLYEEIHQANANSSVEDQPMPDVVEIPVLYGGKRGPDMNFVAEHAKLSEDQIITMHSENEYLVYMMGFTPGFPYLGGLHKGLYTPRLDSPRKSIPAGSVGIAEGQTGIYPVESPGGWRIIGQTPIALFDPRRHPPSLVSSGNHIRFVPLDSESEFARLTKAQTEHEDAS